MNKVVFASNNENKVKEIRHLLDGVVEVLSLSDIGFNEDIPETEETLEGNALLKSHAIFDKFGYDVFSDDTGLEINALNGAPGVYSARYAGEQCLAEDNMKKVLVMLEGKDDRSARFRTVVALILNGKEFLFEGTVNGNILKEKQGDEGFGYDPIFQPKGYSESFAELSLDTKSKISHRGLAVKELVAFLTQRND